ncbi:unnamed protein product, partial [Heterosigma akashiwo]
KPEPSPHYGATAPWGAAFLQPSAHPGNWAFGPHHGQSPHCSAAAAATALPPSPAEWVRYWERYALPSAPGCGAWPAAAATQEGNMATAAAPGAPKRRRSDGETAFSWDVAATGGDLNQSLDRSMSA